MRLKDLGETQILQQMILPRFPSVNDIILGIGDDCAAFMPKGKGHAIVTTIDPCPTPVSFLLGVKDYYHFGWFTVLINVSDLASTGAQPVGLLVSTVMPEDMLVSDYERFLVGLSDASAKFGCPIIGGNIKDGKEFTATGSAFGSIEPHLIMKRKGAKPGDFVCVIGEMGLFWAAVTSILRKLSVKQEVQAILDQALYKPAPKIVEGIQLARNQALTSCMDSSDGITSCLYTLAESNNVDIDIDFKSLYPHPVVEELANNFHIDYKKFMLSWGSWELVGTLSPDSVELAVKVVTSLGSPFRIIGRVIEGNGKVWGIEQNEKGLLTDLGSYRFCNISFFSHGIESYLDYLCNSMLLK
ncbi:MAG: thiamine-phosphate kinase [Thermodesulfovibrionales bacterium]